MPLKDFEELTDKRDRCADWLSCPAVFQRRGTDKLVIIAQKTKESGVPSAELDVGQIDTALVTRALVRGPLSRRVIQFSNLIGLKL